MINERICEGCGDCGAKSNCLSVHPVSTEFGRKTRIHQSSCNADYSCLEGDCPSFVAVVPRPGRRRANPGQLDDTDLPPPVPAVGADPFRMRITGIGGTGIVTVAQVLATAAVIEDREVRALDQTGLAQKGGAVVSDVTITSVPVELAAKLGESQCHLYLGCDALVATDSAHLTAADPDRTIAVVSTTKVPTGRMVADTSVYFPEHAKVRSAVDSASARAVYLDAGSIAGLAFDDDQYANMVLAGAAYQSGAIPLGADAIEQAITLNGVAVAANVQAFRLGRLALADPSKLHAALAPDEHPGPVIPPAAEQLAAETGVAGGSDLANLLVSRTADLISYQDESYARSYAEFVRHVREAEETSTPGESAVTEAVARNLHKLMAYKDEYEVARLALDPAFLREVDATFGPGSKISYMLHPPLLRSMGLANKITLGRWFRVVFRALRAMRRLRGSHADIFGRSRVRRLERQLIGEYRNSVEEALLRLRPDTQHLVIRIADLPDMIRGYEQIKLTSVEHYRAELESLHTELRAGRCGECRDRPAS